LTGKIKDWTQWWRGQVFGFDIKRPENRGPGKGKMQFFEKIFGWAAGLGGETMCGEGREVAGFGFEVAIQG
jgi:hypothetical protein